MGFGVAALLSLAAPGPAVAPAVAYTGVPEAAAPPAPSPRTASATDAPAVALPDPARRPDPVVRADADERLQFGDVRVPRVLVDTIRRAAAETGVDAAYLLALADKESSFSADASARTSSAEGLFQFLNGTWLEVVRTFGARHGLGAEAAAIVSHKGQLAIPDTDTRERVLGLRRDPYVSALMAAEMLKRDRARIAARTGRDLDSTDNYLAHFLGAGSAGRFMALLGEKPEHSAPEVFPQAARANKALFFTREGKKVRHLTVAEVYQRIDRMMDDRIERYEAIAAVPLPTADRLLEDLRAQNPSRGR